MQMLIASGRGINADAERYEISDFVRVEREQRVEREENKPEKPPEPAQLTPFQFAARQNPDRQD